MPTNRKVVFANGEFYHVFNRGVERRIVFTDKYEYHRAIALLEYYSFSDIPFRYSKFLSLSAEERQRVKDNLKEQLVQLVAYCLMPNHFHFLLQQIGEEGISRFMANMTNSYTKYFNTKHQRVGPLFQGLFKAVHVDSQEQLVHLSRYIHLNPVTGYVIKPEELKDYSWSSYPEYLGVSERRSIVTTEPVFDSFQTKESYQQFCLDQVDYARELKNIEHLLME